MEPARAIEKLGFRRWHERELLEAYGWLAVCFLCALAFAASLEGFISRPPGGWPLIAVTAMYLSGIACWHSWQRYRWLQRRADHFAGQSTCASCGRYGLYGVVRATQAIHVRCSGCGREWKITG